MWQPFGSKMNSIGSSSVMICSRRRDSLAQPAPREWSTFRCRRAGHEDEAILIAGQQLSGLPAIQLVHCADLRIDNAKNQIDAQPLRTATGSKPPIHS
jgi:hypothetical protein